MSTTNNLFQNQPREEPPTKPDFVDDSRRSLKLPLAIILIVAALLTSYFALAAWQIWWPFEAQKQQACTQEAKLCPDGSYVGRTGPNCEFAECPDFVEDIIFGLEAEEFCGPEPPAECGLGTRLGCRVADKKWDCYDNIPTSQPIVTFEQCVAAGNPVMESFPEQCRDKSGALFVNWQGAGQFCIQIIAPARNPATGEVREFPTPCDVPEGWKQI